MPMSNESLSKAQAKDESTKASKETKPAPAGELADGSASGDPAVHQLMANRYIASMNQDDEAYANYTAQLAELGFK